MKNSPLFPSEIHVSYMFVFFLVLLFIPFYSSILFNAFWGVHFIFD